MQRYAEAFFRHRRALVVPVALALIISAGLVAIQPRSYQASAGVWFQSNAIAGDTNQANAYLPPADVATGVFRELLNTRAFCLAVGRRGPLASYMAQPGHMPPPDPVSAILGKVDSLRGSSTTSPQQALDDAVQTMVQKHVNVVATGPQIVTVTFEYTNAEVAFGTLRAILDQFSDEVLAAQRVQNEHQAAFYEQQVTNQQKQVTEADAAVARYLVQHPELRVAQPPPDATFSGLQQVASTAHQHLAELLQQRDQAKLQQNDLSLGSSATFRVIDPPVLPHKPVSRLKTVILGAGGGLGVGLLVTVIAIVVLVFTDNTLRTTGEVERLLGLKVAGSIPLRLGAAGRGKNEELASSPKPSPRPDAAA
jgi:uncharacterized protein involved in exopolysaccharide biosynthesis